MNLLNGPLLDLKVSYPGYCPSSVYYIRTSLRMFSLQFLYTGAFVRTESFNYILPDPGRFACRRSTRICVVRPPVVDPEGVSFGGPGDGYFRGVFWP